MPDYIKGNSKRCVKEKQLYCTKQKIQSYDLATFGEVIPIKGIIQCKLQQGCNLNEINYQKYVLRQQNLYALMRRKPYLFPIISWVKEMNLTISEQRAYSNLWYRRFGTSQSLPVNNDWGGFALNGSETPYTN
jgi:hypothetical protein